MKVRIFPGKADGEIQIPPSKSMAHRAIICAALANGTSTIHNIAYSDDIRITIEGMKQLGATIITKEDSIVVNGIKDFNQLKEDVVFCNESGSTLRFFIPIFSLCNRTITFTGKNRLLKRPQSVYAQIFKSQEIAFTQNEDKIQIGGKLSPGHYELDGDVSSQFISGLLFALPLLDKTSTIHIKEPYESRSYIDLTLQMLKLFGIEAGYIDSNTIEIAGNQTYKAHDYTIEGDYSQLAFFAVLAAINNDLKCLGVKHDSKQGDKQILTILKNAGATIQTIKNGYFIKKSKLHESAIDLKNCPDLGPILNVMMMYAKGTSNIYNAQRLRYKESDRIAAMEEELMKCGVQIHTKESEIIITGKDTYYCDEVLEGHKDHRIVMSLCIAATLFDKPVVINGAEAINKSYPAFFDDLQKAGITLEVIHDQ